jgi:hypothetical protein
MDNPNDPNVSLPPYDPALASEIRGASPISDRAEELSQQIAREMSPPDISVPREIVEALERAMTERFSFQINEVAQRVAKLELFLGLKG